MPKRKCCFSRDIQVIYKYIYAMTSATSTPLKTMTHIHATSPTSSTSVSTIGTPTRTFISNASATLPVNDLDVIQDMIDCSADRLEGLRTQCVTSATLTQREIRSLETKLLRMFSELLLTKSRLNERLPASGLPHTSGNELKQWLRVVGLSQDSLDVCLTRLSTLEQLLELNDQELKELLQHNRQYREEEVRRLTKAMENLRKCKDMLSVTSDNDNTHDKLTTAAIKTIIDVSEKSAGNNTKESREQFIEQLFWDSWDHRHHHHRGSVGNIGVNASPRAQRLIVKQVAKQQQQFQQHKQSMSTSRQSPSNDSFSCKSNAAEDSSNTQGSSLTLALTPSPPNSPFTPTGISASFSNILSGSGGGSLNGTPLKGRGTTTPPPLKKLFTALNTNHPLTPTHTALIQQQSGCVEHHISIPLSKSKSNESQATLESSSSASTIISSPSSWATNNMKSYPVSGCNTRSRLNTDPSPDSHSSASSELFVESSNSSNNNSLQVPLSPCTPVVNHLGMSHSIAHRFNTVFKMTSTTCDLCQKPMFLGRKCKECKYRCHKLCEPDVPPSCCLPPEFIDEFKNAIKDQVGYHSTLQRTPPILNTHSPNQSSSYGTIGKGRIGITPARHQKHGCTASGMHADSSSPGSSCNSSSPSSPALFNLQHQTPGVTDGPCTTVSGNLMSSSAGGSSSTSSNVLSTPSSHKNASQFNFPDVTITSNCNHPANGTTETILSSAAQNSQEITGSNKASSYTNNNTSVSITMPGSISITPATNNSVMNSGPSGFFQRKLSSAGIDKRGPFIEISDTHKSNDSDKTVSLSGSTSASTDSDRTPVRLDSTEDGDSGNWPRQNSLSLKEWDIEYSDLQMLEIIGQGRFGTVHRALWHGSVAVKLLKEDYLDDEHMLEAFKLEVANFKKTRHENLVLFMGACMNPPYLAIVTSLCKGNTLYTHIHARREKFVINKTTLIAQQITQGMGYLHARGIIHKDLRTKNIFLENGKVIITDFGLFSSTKLQYNDRGLGVPIGWLCYIAPELMRCLMPRKLSDEILPFSSASDVYSFGTVWYELLCGEFPFKSQPPEAVIWQVGRGMKQTLANLQTSRDVKDVLMLCWHYTADDRPDFPKLLTMFERLPKKRLARSPSHPVQLSRSAEAIF
uniref:Protein kinase domain-containing protein n=1 Tax=Glossina palpalis gambiensis TaxID=67801 RepID=A0A1B0C385_9MUSC